MLHKLQKKDINKAAQVLGESFSDYPIFKYVFPDDQYRKNKINHLFRFLIKYGMLNGEVFAPSDNIEGVSIWINSSNKKSSLWNVLKAGLISLFLNIDKQSFDRFSYIGKYKQNTRTNLITNNYYLLDTIGVDPQLQKKGFARLLMEAKLEEIDQLKIPCYLETSDKMNLNFYKKFGFEIIHEYELASVKVFCLFRELSCNG